ncbi:MAG: aminotransferase class IV, partial [Pseudomonadota bacterium]
MSDDPHGVHDFVYDPRNADIKVSINGDLKHRDEASVSVFESGYLLGDGVWEGLRVHKGGVAFLPEHFKRLYAGAKTIDMDIGLTPEELKQRLFDCLNAQDMTDGVHIRLMVTRGIKKTPYQGPRFTITPPTIVIIPEYKSPVPEIIEKGVSLFTAHVRRTGPAEQDQKLNSHSKLNCILACIQADKAGADEALMLDPDGFVATCN